MRTFYQKVKAVAVFLAIFLNGTILLAQDITGQWNGALSIQGVNMRIVFHVNKIDGGYAATMDSPDQNAAGISVAATTFDGSKLSLAIPAIGLSYEGEFKNDSIAGTFKQHALSMPMTLKRTPVEVKPLVRPQEPKPPYPYFSEDVTFENKAAGITLSGTLTMPSTGSNFTAVILVTGSGAQNRNEEILGHKPFLVIADYLTRRGIAVLRYDDRGFAQSTGDFTTATTADFASDAESAVAYLKTRKEINPNKTGLMGHSEGGVIAPMVAARSNDIAFIVMLAGTGIRGDKLLLLQQELIYRASGMPEDKLKEIIKANAKVFDRIVNTQGTVTQQELAGFMSTLKDDIAAVTPDGMTVDDVIQQSAKSLSTPWMQYFMRYDPVPALEKVKCPVLAVNGGKDLQVPAKENLTAIREALEKGGNKKATFKVYPDLNHLFQECSTGAPSEYGTIEQTFSSEVLKDLTEWIINN
jgi:pimeloyl-ACP methyl ester carboxylesterase